MMDSPISTFDVVIKVLACVSPLVLFAFGILLRSMQTAQAAEKLVNAQRFDALEGDVRSLMDPKDGSAARLDAFKLHIAETMLTAEKVQHEIQSALAASPINQRLSAIESQNELHSKLMTQILTGVTNLATRQHP